MHQVLNIILSFMYYHFFQGFSNNRHVDCLKSYKITDKATMNAHVHVSLPVYKICRLKAIDIFGLQF